jgi:hypothetical protein
MATIKAGTYRFNDVLSAPSGTIEQDINFAISVSGHEAIADHLRVYYSASDNGGTLSEVVSIEYRITECPTLVGVILPITSTVYECVNGILVGGDGWSDSFGDPEELQLITIPTDTDVSAEFGTWFAENAKPCISGVWKLNDSLVFSQGDIEESVNVSVDLTYEGVKCVAFVDTIYVDADAKEVSGNSYRVEPEGTTLEEGIGFGYFNGSWDWETWGDVVNVFDFGTEPQPVSAEFYEWLTANAVQPVATVTYNGAVIANLFDGQTATLKCKGKKMESDIVVVLA